MENSIFIILPLLSLIGFKTKKHLIGVITSLSFLLMALRGVGTDYLVIKRNFFFFDKLSPYFFDRKIIGYIKNMNYLAEYRFQFYIMIISLITMIFIYNFVKENKKNSISIGLILFFLSYSYFGMFNYFRQGVAISIYLYSTKHIIQQNKIKFLLYMLLGSIFHTSLLFLSVTYFVPKIKIDMKKSFFISIVFALLGYLGVFSLIIRNIPFFGVRYSNFGSYSNTRESFLLLRILIEILIVNLFIYFIKIKKLDKKQKFFYKMIYINLFIFIISNFFIIFFRMYLYTNIVAIFGYAFLYRKAKNKKIWLFLLITYYLYTYTRFILTGAAAVYPYKFFEL